MDAEAARIAIVACSFGPGKFADISTNLAERLGTPSFEVIGIFDARSLAEGYSVIGTGAV